MDLIPEEELKKWGSINLAPMVDFLFLLVAVFATLAVTRAIFYDTEIQLVKTKEREEQDAQKAHLVNIAITEDGKYKWLTEANSLLVIQPQAIKEELLRQQRLGRIPEEGSQIKILLHIDQKAHWKNIARTICTFKEAGFTVYPVYEPLE